MAGQQDPQQPALVFINQVYPDFSDIKDMFQCVTNASSSQYEYIMFEKLANKGTGVIKPLCQILRQFKAYVIQQDKFYSPSKHTAISYFLSFFVHFGIEEYLKNPDISDIKKELTLSRINDSFSFLFEFVRSKSIVSDRAYPTYRTKIESYRQLYKRETSNTVIILDDEADDSHKNTDIDTNKTPTSASNTEFSTVANNSPISTVSKEPINTDKVTNDQETCSKTSLPTEPTAQVTDKTVTSSDNIVIEGGRRIVVHQVPITESIPNNAIEWSEDDDDSDDDSNNTPSNLKYEDYIKLIDTLNTQIFGSSSDIKTIQLEHTLDLRLELMLGFYCKSTILSNLNTTVSQIKPFSRSVFEGLEITSSETNQNKTKNRNTILVRHANPEYCPVFAICFQLLLVCYTSTNFPFSLFTTNYHQMIQSRRKLLKSENLSNISALTTMKDTCNNFFETHGFRGFFTKENQETLLNKSGSIDEKEYTSLLIRRGCMLSGLTRSDMLPIPRTQVSVPGELVSSIIKNARFSVDTIPTHASKMLLHYAIIVVLQDIPYFGKTYSFQILESFPFFKQSEYKNYIAGINNQINTTSIVNDILQTTSSTGHETDGGNDVSITDTVDWMSKSIDENLNGANTINKTTQPNVPKPSSINNSIDSWESMNMTSPIQNNTINITHQSNIPTLTGNNTTGQNPSNGDHGKEFDTEKAIVDLAEYVNGIGKRLHDLNSDCSKFSLKTIENDKVMKRAIQKVIETVTKQNSPEHFDLLLSARTPILTKAIFDKIQSLFTSLGNPVLASLDQKVVQLNKDMTNVWAHLMRFDKDIQQLKTQQADASQTTMNDLSNEEKILKKNQEKNWKLLNDDLQMLSTVSKKRRSLGEVSNEAKRRKSSNTTTISVSNGNVSTNTGNTPTSNMSPGNIGNGHTSFANIVSNPNMVGNNGSSYMYSTNMGSTNMYPSNMNNGNMNSGNMNSGNMTTTNIRNGNMNTGNMSTTNIRNGNLHHVNNYPANVATVNNSSTYMRNGNIYPANNTSTNNSPANTNPAYNSTMNPINPIHTPTRTVSSWSNQTSQSYMREGHYIESVFRRPNEPKQG